MAMGILRGLSLRSLPIFSISKMQVTKTLQFQLRLLLSAAPAVYYSHHVDACWLKIMSVDAAISGLGVNV